MSEKERISNPSMGSNKLGSETREQAGTGMPAGSDTQTRIAALDADKKRQESEKDERVNDDELIVNNKDGRSHFPIDATDNTDS